MFALHDFLEQKYLGSAGGIDGLLEENTRLEQELELLEQDTVRYQISFTFFSINDYFLPMGKNTPIFSSKKVNFDALLTH